MNRMRSLAAIPLVIALWGCAAQPPAPTPRPSSPASPSAPAPTPSSSPDPSAPPPSTPPSVPPSTPPGPVLELDSIAKVVTDDLRVRSLPEVSDASAKLTPLLNQPTLVYVVAGPVEGSGYTWYEIAPVGNLQRAQELPFGWVAAADKDGTPWLAAAAPDCPAKPATVDDLFAVDDVLALACFGDTPLTVSARIADPEATCGIDIGWSIDPEWLAGTCPQPAFLLESPTSQGLSVNAVIDPSVDVRAFRPGPEPAEWMKVRLTGRFDHPEAKSCHVIGTGAPATLSKDQLVLSCRATFVITRIVKA